MSNQVRTCPFCDIELEEKQGTREIFWQHPTGVCYLRHAVVYQNGSLDTEFLTVASWNRRRSPVSGEAMFAARQALGFAALSEPDAAAAQKLHDALAMVLREVEEGSR